MKIATTTGDFLTGWGDYDSYTPNPFDVVSILKKLSECGFKYIDLSFGSLACKESPLMADDWHDWVKILAKSAEELGLQFVQAHSSDSVYAKGTQQENCNKMIKRQIEACGILGIKNIVVHALYTQNGTREDFLEKNYEFYSELLKTAERANVCICTENTCVKNCPTYYIVCADDFHRLDEKLGKHQNFGCCWDVGHAHVEGVDQYEEIMAFGERLKAVHIHDNLSTGDFHMQLYSGNCCFDAIVIGLIDIGFKGFFTLESFSIPSPQNFLGKKRFYKNGVEYDKIRILPLELKMQSEKLMYNTARFMLESYDCFEE